MYHYSEVYLVIIVADAAYGIGRVNVMTLTRSNMLKQCNESGGFGNGRKPLSSFLDLHKNYSYPLSVVDTGKV